MPVYQFEALSDDGHEIHDTLEATSADELQKTLRTLGYFTTKISELKPSHADGRTSKISDFLRSKLGRSTPLAPDENFSHKGLPVSTYEFEATDAEGDWFSDTVEATSRESAISTIQSLGYFLTKFEGEDFREVIPYETSTDPSQLISFKFKWLDSNGDESGVFKRTGEFDGEYLSLDEVVIAADSVLSLTVRKQAMGFEVEMGDDNLYSLSLIHI